MVQFYTEDSLNFQERISQRNGLGNATSFPPSLHHEPPVCNMITAREEAELVLFGCVKEALAKAGELPSCDVNRCKASCQHTMSSLMLVDPKASCL